MIWCRGLAMPVIKAYLLRCLARAIQILLRIMRNTLRVVAGGVELLFWHRIHGGGHIWRQTLRSLSLMPHPSTRLWISMPSSVAIRLIHIICTVEQAKHSTKTIVRLINGCGCSFSCCRRCNCSRGCCCLQIVGAIIKDIAILSRR